MTVGPAAAPRVLPSGQPPGRAGAAHVLGGGPGNAAAARLAALIEPAFLAEAGWDRGTRVLSLPPGHLLLGWRACPAPGCANPLYGPARECGTCRRASAGQPVSGHHSERPEEGHHRGDMRPVPLADRELCRVHACPRERGNRRYCRAHYERVLKHRRADPSFDERACRRPNQRSDPRSRDPGRSACTAWPR